MIATASDVTYWLAMLNLLKSIVGVDSPFSTRLLIDDMNVVSSLNLMVLPLSLRHVCLNFRYTPGVIKNFGICA
jgi:hypothetical protein